MEGSTFSLGNRSVLSIVYGREQDVVLDEAMHKAMFDQSTVENDQNSLTVQQAEPIAVFQKRQGQQEDSVTIKTTTNNNSGEEGEKTAYKKCCSCCAAGNLLNCDCWKPFRKTVKRVVSSKLFEAGIIFIILINTLFMSIQHHGMDEDLERAIDIVNSVSILVSVTMRFPFEESLSFTYMANGKRQIQVENFSK